jgi:hypothetical protein
MEKHPERDAVLNTVESDHSSQTSSSSERIALDLRMLLGEMKATGCSEIMTEIIIDSLKAHQNVAKIQDLCLKAIVEIFTKDETFDSTVFVAAKGVARIIDTMERFPASLDIQELACDALAVLAMNDFNRLDMIEDRVCE